MEWGYAEAARGPLNWGSLTDADGSLAYPACRSCRACLQSPIDVTRSPRREDVTSGALRDVVRPPGKPVELAVAQKHGTPNFTAVDGSSLDAAGGIVADGVAYRFASLHFHTPAENTVDGVAYPMEMHMVGTGARTARTVSSTRWLTRSDERDPLG